MTGCYSSILTLMALDELIEPSITLLFFMWTTGTFDLPVVKLSALMINRT